MILLGDWLHSDDRHRATIHQISIGEGGFGMPSTEKPGEIQFLQT